MVMEFTLPPKCYDYPFVLSAPPTSPVRHRERQKLSTSNESMNRRFSILSLLVLSLGIYVATAAQPALLDDADASHALVSREMLQRGDWVVMYQDGIRYLEKAPLHYWMVAVSYKLFGQGAFQTRLPLVLSVAALVLMVYFFARRFFGETAAFYSGLITCTSVGTWLFTRVMVPEAIFALELTALFYLFLRGWQGTLDTRVAYWGASVVMALSALTLGLIGVLFPLGVVFFFIVFTRSWGRWRELRIFSSTLIFSDHRRALALDRGTPLARIPVVLFHQRALQARPRHPLSAGLRSRASAAVVGPAPGLVLSLELLHHLRSARIPPAKNLGTKDGTNSSRPVFCSSSGRV